LLRTVRKVCARDIARRIFPRAKRNRTSQRSKNFGSAITLRESLFTDSLVFDRFSASTCARDAFYAKIFLHMICGAQRRAPLQKPSRLRVKKCAAKRAR
jgi:hypothetical protein